MNQDLQNEKEAKHKLDMLEKQIEECRIQYELYFMGTEKREPVQLREDIKRQISLLLQSRNKQATYRFRLNSLSNRYQSLSRYWDRINYEREQGIFHKDKMRTRRRFFGKNDTESPSSGNLTAHDLPHSHDQADTPPDGVPAFMGYPTDAAAPQAPALSQARMKQIYDSYIETRRQCNEPTHNVSFQSLISTLEKQIPRLKEKGYNEVDFQVIVKDGKAALKPVGKR